jgi:NAD(P)-dependent dehydrogenase (short-subunit alcohol dehydrogenase family)
MGIRPVIIHQKERAMGSEGEEARSVLVTGASGGIGRASVRALLHQRFAVWAAVRHETSRVALRAQFGDRVRTVAFDLTDDAAIARVADQVSAAGPLYGLVNNAGAALPGPLEYVPIEQFQRQIEINLTGQLRVTQALLPALRDGAARWGDARIILMGSLDGRIVGPLFGPYAASKHALVGLADGLRSELSPAGIKVVLLECTCLPRSGPSGWLLRCGRTGPVQRSAQPRPAPTQPHAISAAATTGLRSRFRDRRYQIRNAGEMPAPPAVPVPPA